MSRSGHSQQIEEEDYECYKMSRRAVGYFLHFDIILYINHGNPVTMYPTIKEGIYVVHLFNFTLCGVLRRSPGSAVSNNVQFGKVVAV